MGFAEESGVMVSNSYDGTIRQWRMVSRARIRESTQKYEGEVKKVVFSDNGQKLMTCSTYGTLLQWDVSNGKPVGKPMKRRLDRVTCIAVNGQCGIIVAVYAQTFYGKIVKNEVVRWNMNTCEMIGDPIVVRQQYAVTCVALSSNGK